MSAVYRIDVEHTPANPIAQWSASIFSIDPATYGVIEHEWSRVGDSADEVEHAARRWIARETAQRKGYSVYVNERGETLAEHSVRA